MQYKSLLFDPLLSSDKVSVLLENNISGDVNIKCPLRIWGEVEEIVGGPR